MDGGFRIVYDSALAYYTLGRSRCKRIIFQVTTRRHSSSIHELQRLEVGKCRRRKEEVENNRRKQSAISRVNKEHVWGLDADWLWR